MKKIHSTITISKPHRAGTKDVINIELVATTARIRVVNVEIPLEDFARAIMGTVNVPCTTVVPPAAVLQHLGDHREVITVDLIKPAGFPISKTEIPGALKPIIKPWIDSGWELFDDGTYARQNNPIKHTVKFYRYTESD